MVKQGIAPTFSEGSKLKFIGSGINIPGDNTENVLVLNNV